LREQHARAFVVHCRCLYQRMQQYSGISRTAEAILTKIFSFFQAAGILVAAHRQGPTPVA
jgi:hypothetical protein